MKKIYTVFFLTVLFISSPLRNLLAQCGATYTQSQLNWDYLDYMVSTGSYAGFVTNAQAGNQSFAIGPNRVSILASVANMVPGGENATHTGELAGFTGQDVQYTPAVNGDSLVITFNQEVANARFVLYDIDNLASFTISARNASGTALNPVVTLQASTVLALGGVPTAVTVGTSNNTNLANNSNQGSALVTVAGPVRVIKVAITNRGADPMFWLSDINACVTGGFPNSYRIISRPFTGMPAYVIVVNDNQFYLLDPHSGRVKPFFTDPAAISYNSLAYDPYNRMLYYTPNRSGAGGAVNPNNKTIKRYSVDAESINTIVADVSTSLNIPTFDNGMESAAASFHGGYYYVGVEGYNAGRTSGRENVIWRVEFDAALNPLRSCQVYAARADSFWSSANRLRHDWSDFGVSDNNMLYDFDGASGDEMYYHFNMMTGQRIQFTPSGGGYVRPNQVAINWRDSLFNEGGISGLSSTGFVAPYNYNGTINTARQYALYTNPGPVNPSGNWADAAEAYRPLCDFGDAPATYDPDPWSPAVHERDTALRIGPTFDREWNKTSSVLANADGADEDGLSFVPIFSPNAGNYLAQVSVYNNTGTTATLIAWLDFNGNGLFDAGETCQDLLPVPSMPAAQNRWLYWPSAPSTLPNGSFTYLRIRLTKTANGMDAADATGYYEDGETEDYRIIVDDYPLKANLLAFSAKAENNERVLLSWSSNGEENFSGYEIQRSTDNSNWSAIGFANAAGNGAAGTFDYNYADMNPVKGKGYYRLKLVSLNGKNNFSEVRVATIRSALDEIVVSPNPATDYAQVSFQSQLAAEITISVLELNGRVVLRGKKQAAKGFNSITLPPLAVLQTGTYIVQLQTGNEMFTTKLLVSKQ